MTPAGAARLLTLAAIWGGSYLFMRIAAPEIGAYWVAETRLVLAAVFLSLTALWLKNALHAARYWRHYVVPGLFNSALPFLLFAYAAETLSASLLSIINATAPLWGALIGAALGRQELDWRRGAGLALGFAGVGVLVGLDSAVASSAAVVPVVAAMVATFCYGIASTYAASAPSVGSFANARGSLWASTLILLPAAFLVPPPEAPSATSVSALVVLSVVCSGLAYILYFKLIEDDGATSALSVTFLIPLFGVLWGYLFLNEAVGWHTLAGGMLVLVGTALVTGLLPRVIREGKTTRP